MLGILKPSLQNTDKDFFMIRNLNKLVHTPINSCVFCVDADPTTTPLLTNVLQRIQLLYFNGIIITDDLTEAQSLINIPNAKKRFLYLYHVEWPYINNLHFKHLESVFLHDHIDLIARSDAHAMLIEQVFKSPKYVMPEWDYNTLIRIDQNE